MNVAQTQIAVQFSNSKVHDYVVNILTNAKIDWKDANLHNEAISCMMRGTIVPPDPEPKLQEGIGPVN